MAFFEPMAGATPIEDVSELLPTHILTRDELNEWEAANILKALRRFLRRGKLLVITIDWLKKVHRLMFDETWRWAGLFRKKNYNLGVDWHRIPKELKILIDDLNYWGRKKTRSGMGLLEQSVRLHHRLVKIHPFVNGNGRFARLVADIFLFSHGQKLPEWPETKLIEKTDIRKKYIQALHSADQGDYDALEKFTRVLINSRT